MRVGFGVEEDFQVEAFLEAVFRGAEGNLEEAAPAEIGKVYFLSDADKRRFSGPKIIKINNFAMFWPKHPKKFFSQEEQERIMDEIRRAEDKTSGEIRVHLDHHLEEDTLEKAKKVFQQLGMTKTKYRNGVLIYLNPQHRKFAIYGDEGINKVVAPNYWEDIKEGMQKFFRAGKFCDGLCWGIRQVGEKLKIYFPIERDDQNEHPDSISES